MVFPQLLTGASALYPVTLKLIQRTVVNVLGDGSTVVFADPDAAATGWELHASGMTLAEWTAVEALFIETSGMWQTFTFLDPTGNLLEQSENFGAGAWTNGALIELTTGVGDPLGTTRAKAIWPALWPTKRAVTDTRRSTCEPPHCSAISRSPAPMAACAISCCG